MKLDKPTMDLIINYIYQRWNYPRRCPICGNLTWNVNNCLMELREYNGGGMAIGGDQQYIPLITIICGNCGYIVFLNGLATGILKPGTQLSNTNLPDEPETTEEPEVPPVIN